MNSVPLITWIVQERSRMFSSFKDSEISCISGQAALLVQLEQLLCRYSWGSVHGCSKADFCNWRLIFSSNFTRSTRLIRFSTLERFKLQMFVEKRSFAFLKSSSQMFMMFVKFRWNLLAIGYFRRKIDGHLSELRKILGHCREPAYFAEISRKINLRHTNFEKFANIAWKKVR